MCVSLKPKRLSSEGDVLHKLVLVLCVRAGALYKGHGECSRLTEQVLIAARESSRKEKNDKWTFSKSKNRKTKRKKAMDGYLMA